MTEFERDDLHEGGPGLHFRLAGDREAPPILFLHGWPQDGEMWKPVTDRLGTAAGSIVPDLRGFGRSEAAGRLDASVLIADQLRLLRHLGVGPVHLVGHDWGGWIGILLALEYPSLVSTLTVLNAPHPWPRLGLSAVGQIPKSWYAAVLATPGLGPGLLRRGRLVPGILRRDSDGAITESESARLTAIFAEPDRAASVSSLYRYYWRAFTGAALGRWNDRRIEVPTLFVFGRRDRMISSELVAEGPADHARASRVELVEGAGHFICDQRPDLVAAHVSEHAQLSS